MQNSVQIITWRTILILLFLFGVLYLTVNLVRSRTKIPGFAEGIGATNIVVTDISKDELGVVYHTDSDQPTLVKYQFSSQDRIAVDVLGTRPLKNHFARLTSLTPGSKIFCG